MGEAGHGCDPQTEKKGGSGHKIGQKRGKGDVSREEKKSKQEEKIKKQRKERWSNVEDLKPP